MNFFVLHVTSAYVVNCKKHPLTAEYLPLTLLRKLTNGNFKKNENSVNEINIPFLPLKLTN